MAATCSPSQLFASRYINPTRHSRKSFERRCLLRASYKDAAVALLVRFPAIPSTEHSVEALIRSPRLHPELLVALYMQEYYLIYLIDLVYPKETSLVL